MKKSFRWSRRLLLYALSWNTAFTAFAAGDKFIPGQILVKPRASASMEEFHALVRQHGATTNAILPDVGIHVLRVPEERAEQVLDALSHNPQIEFAERDFVAEAVLTPNDPYFSGNQWHLPKIQAPAAWDITTGSAGTVIAVVDTGVNAAHPDLAGKVLAGYDYVHNDSDPSDDVGHGTEVSGTAAAFGNNGVGVAGVAFANQILPVKVLDATGSGSYSAIINGITYAANHGARVINLSLAGSSSSSSLQNAIDYAWNRNVVIVAAAGNTGAGAPQYPAACRNVVAVSATDANDTLANFSSYGSDVSLSAPGVNITTTAMDGGYVAVSGTSFSSPIVCGVVALMASINPQLSNAQLVNLLRQNTDDLGLIGYDIYYGYGRVNASKAVAAARAALTASTVPAVIQLLSPRRNGNNFTFSFNTTAGFSYAVQSANDLTSTWSTQTNVSGNGSLCVVTAPLNTTVAQRFYRVLIQ